MVKGNLVESSCYAHGHDDRVCRRCGKIERETLPLSQHKYEFKEKKDATATSEGYVRYECKVCHDVYDAVLPKVSSDGRPFYVNLVYSLLSPDFRTYSSTLEEDGSTQFYESYQGLDYDGQPFEYSSSGFAEYKGYMYYSGNEYDRYQYSYTTVSSQFEYYKQFIDALPSIYKEKFNDLVSWFAEKYFVQTETPEGYEFGLNYAAIKETVDLFVNESIGDAIKGVIGQKTYDDILDFISKHYGDTVKEFLDELESRGFIIQELYDSIVTVLKSNGAQDDDIPALDSILTEDIKKMKLTEFAAFVLSQIMGGDQEQISASIPQTYADFKEMLDSYLDVNLLDLIENITKMMSGSEEGGVTAKYLKDMIKEVTDQLDSEHVSMKLKTTKDGGFISLESSVNGFKVPGMDEQETAYALITKNYDKAEIIGKLEERVRKCEVRENAYVLDSNHYEWLANPYEEYFQAQYPGLKFSYVRDYHNTGYDALVSNVDVKSLIATDNSSPNSGIKSKDGAIAEPDTGEAIPEEDPPGGEGGSIGQGSSGGGSTSSQPEYKEGKLIIKLRDYNYGYITRNEYGLGEVLARGEYGLITSTYYYVSYPTIEFTTEGGLTSETRYGDLPNFGILFNLDKEEYHYADEGCTFNYLNERYEKYYAVSWAEYDAYMQARYEEMYGHSSSGPVMHEDYYDREYTRPFTYIFRHSGNGIATIGLLHSDIRG